MDNIMQNRLDRAFYAYQKEYEAKALEVLRSGWYVLGKEVSSFEQEFAQYVQAKYCVGVGNGLDALWLSFRILEIGKDDEVIVPSNTYIASVMGITINGATPVFVEPDEFFNINPEKIEEKITSKTKAILVVHLYGQACQMKAIVDLCKKYHLRLVEDCAQSHGAKCDGKITGTFGDVGCFSFYPSKNLGAFGDAGAIVTDNEDIARKFTMYRNYGSEKRYYNKVVGANSRLDELQAGLLRVRLLHMKEITAEREVIAKKYTNEIENNKIVKPSIAKDVTSVWHQYVVRCEERERLLKLLIENNIDAIIHYPIPPHLAEAYKYLGYHIGDFPIAERYSNTILSLPIYSGMTISEQTRVIDVLNRL
ncbi:MAG: DegT/DnrJ/EryC1/StrS family aminotransferase [Ruthenibacterium sp.]